MTIPHGKIEAVAKGLRRARFKRTRRLASFDDTVPPNEQEILDATDALSAAAEYDRTHPPKVTDAMVEAAARIFCTEVCDFRTGSPLDPCSFCDGGGMQDVARRAIEAALREMSATEGK